MNSASRVRALIAGLALFLVAIAPDARAQVPIVKSNNLKLHIPYNAAGINGVPFWIGIDSGAFLKYGLEVTTEFTTQSPALISSMLSGETPFAIAGQAAVLSADLNGGDIVLLAASLDKLFFSVMSLPNIKSVKELKGKTIGITGFGTTTDFIARYVLQQAGLDPAKDATILPFGTQANMLAALRSGQVDSAVLGSDVTLRAEQVAGFNPIAPMVDTDLYFYSCPLVGKQSWIKAHPADTLNVVRGFLTGVAAISQDKKAVFDSIKKYIGTTDSDAIERAHELLLKTLPKSQAPLASVLQAGLDSMKAPAARRADPKRFIDGSFVEQLEKDGFVANLYK